jgi:hypothetical protein
MHICGERLHSFLLGGRQSSLLLPLLFNIVSQILSNAIKREEGIKYIQTEKEELSPSLHINESSLYRRLD